MDYLRSLIGVNTKRIRVPKVATDDVYPVHFFDDTKPFREMLLNWTLRFDDVLDAEKLHVSLAKLMEIGDWRKLGGRMRLTFTSARPAIRFSHDVHDFSIKEHNTAKHLPTTTSTPSVQPGVINFYHLGARQDAPRTLEDLLCSDEPGISLHVVSFNDATLVGLLFSHVLFGAAGMQALVEAWSQVLAGREAEVPAIHGARKDILDDVGVETDPEKEPFLLEPRQLKGFRHFRFTLRFLWDIMRRPEIESKILCLPGDFVASLRARAMADLHAMDEKGLGTEEAPFVSEGDVLTAWWTRLVCLARGSNRPVTVLNAVDITGRLKTVFAPGKLYVQNFALGTWTLLSSAEVLKAPLGYVARCFRYDIQTQTTPSQIMAFMRRLRSGGRCKNQPLYGDPNSMLIIFTNWARCKFFECIDFSPAVIPRISQPVMANSDIQPTDDVISAGGDPEKKANATIAEIAYHHSLARTRTVLSRNVFTILGKDLNGNYWISALGHPECWDKLEKEVAISSMDELRRLNPQPLN
ncbi:lysR family regulatory protein [Colletotrichum tofieldiae]|nr:lysR family regulatory protein [Colletotrichum tofieldiae]